MDRARDDLTAFTPPRMQEEQVSIAASDGFPLGATVFTPDRPAQRCVLMLPAAGVLRRLYADYARFLAGRGLAVVTWDWRGTGDSRPASLRGFDARMRDWGSRDLAGIIRWCREHVQPDFCAVCHSYGGQALGLAEGADNVSRVITVGSQSGYMGFWPWRERLRMGLLWYLIVPVVTRLWGYFPAKPFALGEDLPKGVALEWARWCRSPDYHGTWEGHKAIKAPLLSIGFSDDYFAPRPALEWLHDRYGSTRKTLRWITPAEAGVAYVGHFGFFRKDLVPALWQETADWLAGDP